MATSMVSDELWQLIHPLLPLEPPKPKGGRPRVPDRAALEGILYVLQTGIGWEHLPHQLGYGSGMTCWRRLRDWHAAGENTRLHHVLLDRMAQAHQLDWTRACVDSTSVPAARGGPNGPESHGSRPAWQQASCDRRWPRDTIGGLYLARQSA